METDDRYSLFGFKVNDYGCCKSLSYKSWGHHVYAGSIFTFKPVELTVNSDDLTITVKAREEEEKA